MDELPDEENAAVEFDEETLALRTEQFFNEAVPATVSDILQMADSFDPLRRWKEFFPGMYPTFFIIIPLWAII